MLAATRSLKCDSVSTTSAHLTDKHCVVSLETLKTLSNIDQARYLWRVKRQHLSVHSSDREGTKEDRWKTGQDQCEGQNYSVIATQSLFFDACNEWCFVYGPGVCTWHCRCVSTTGWREHRSASELTEGVRSGDASLQHQLL